MPWECCSLFRMIDASTLMRVIESRISKLELITTIDGFYSHYVSINNVVNNSQLFITLLDRVASYHLLNRGVARTKFNKLKKKKN